MKLAENIGNMAGNNRCDLGQRFALYQVLSSLVVPKMWGLKFLSTRSFYLSFLPLAILSSLTATKLKKLSLPILTPKTFRSTATHLGLHPTDTHNFGA